MIIFNKSFDYVTPNKTEESPMREIHELLNNNEIHLIREKGTVSANILYCDMCYPNMVGNQKWKIMHTDCLLRALVTEADEALAAVIIENNFEEWDVLAKGMDVNKDKRLTKYTHGGEESGGTRKGWSLQGKERYNEMFDTIDRLRRSSTHGEKLEVELNRLWKETSMYMKRKRSNLGEEQVEAELRRKKREEEFKPRFSAF